MLFFLGQIQKAFSHDEVFRGQTVPLRWHIRGINDNWRNHNESPFPNCISCFAAASAGPEGKCGLREEFLLLSSHSGLWGAGPGAQVCVHVGLDFQGAHNLCFRPLLEKKFTYSVPWPQPWLQFAQGYHPWKIRCRRNDRCVNYRVEGKNYLRIY